MSAKTGIEWTDSTWNPIRGVKGRHHCSKISPACANCYAELMNLRFSGLPYVKGADTFRLDEKALALPLRWKEPRRIFVCSMTDLFHEDLTNDQIAQVFVVMREARHHTFQVLTKRPERMQKLMTEWNEDFHFFYGHCSCLCHDVDGDTNIEGGCKECNDEHIWPLPNVWLGVTVESPDYTWRIEELLQTPAAVRFVSYEPALRPVDFRRYMPPVTDPGHECASSHVPKDTACRDYLEGANGRCVYCDHENKCHPGPGATCDIGRGSDVWLDWLICGGESGPKARPCDLGWLLSAVRQCKSASVPCFVKQLGAKAASGSSGFTWRDWPKRDSEGRCIHDRKGGDWTEWPEDLRVREFPKGAP